jgi:hypothetical protein
MAKRKTTKISNADAKPVVIEILQRQNDNIVGLTITQFHQSFRDRELSISRDELTQLLQQMVKDNELEECDNPKRAGTQLYHLPDKDSWQGDLFPEFRPKEDIERETLSESDLWTQDETERAKVTVSVLQEIATEHADKDNYARQVKEIASILATESPVKLILEAAHWVVQDLNQLATQIQSEKKGHTSQVAHLTRELGFRRTKAIRFFQRLWRFDAPSRSSPGILHLPIVEKMIEGERAEFVDVGKAKERLTERVFGNQFLEIVSVPENQHRATVGTDASVGDIKVQHDRGSFIPPTPAALFVAAGAMQVHDKKDSYRDFDIYPRDIDKYNDLEAAEKGLLISPKLRREAITDFRHLRSAAMALRQYEHERRIIQGDSSWHPMGGVPELQRPPTITLLIRDGRIFPLVHRLTDYDGASMPDDVLYGEVVRREIRAFDHVFQNTAVRGRMGAIYCGAVKAPEFSWLAGLTFWYLHTSKNQQNLSDGFYRPPLNDQAVTHLLFWGLAESKKDEIFADERYVLKTFGAVRRFCDIAFPSHPLLIPNEVGKKEQVIDENSEDDWFAYIEHHIQDANHRYKQHKRGVPALTTPNEYGVFLNLCRRAGITMFHAVPARMYRNLIEYQSHSHFLLPRWEIAVDVTSNTASTLKDKIDRLLAWITDEGELTIDEQHAGSEHETDEPGLPLWIPTVVMEAHKTVTFVRDEHTKGITNKIYQLILDIQEGKLPFVTK